MIHVLTFILSSFIGSVIMFICYVPILIISSKIRTGSYKPTQDEVVIFLLFSLAMGVTANILNNPFSLFLASFIILCAEIKLVGPYIRHYFPPRKPRKIFVSRKKEKCKETENSIEENN